MHATLYRGVYLMKKRVVITGMGVVSSLGTGVSDFWESIKNGRCGISTIERVDISDLPTTVAAEIKDFNPEFFIDRKEAKRMDRFTQYAVAASQLAIDNSALDLEKVDRERMGVIVGSGIGGIETFENQLKVLEEKGPNRISPFFVPMMIANMATGLVAIRFGAKGFNECVNTACATSANAIGDAFRVIQRGEADIMIAGGAESPLTKLAIAGFCANRAMSVNKDPKKACRPFDLDRDGFIMGEGSGIVILEEMEHALRRGAEITAEITGYGCTNDAFHITAPAEGGEGAARCMKLAVLDAGISPEDVGYINAHGTSTDLNDKNETLAIKRVFGDYAYKLHVSSTKSMTGHMMGAAGAIETIITALSLKHKLLPPTINYNTPDPDCDLNYIPNKAISCNVAYAMTNSFGFGGHNAALVLKQF